MKRISLLFAFCFFAAFASVNAQPRPSGDFGFGIVLGEPLGATVKYYTGRTNAIQGHIGSSYFGSPRLGADYLWHFDAFSSNVVGMYAGPGLAIGFGQGRGYFFGKREDLKRSEGDVGIGVRGVFGINVVPRRIPLEFFLELGPMIGISPAFGTKVEAAVGVRFYP